MHTYHLLCASATKSPIHCHVRDACRCCPAIDTVPCPSHVVGAVLCLVCREVSVWQVLCDGRVLHSVLGVASSIPSSHATLGNSKSLWL
jgi:hypothetical protein